MKQKNPFKNFPEYVLRAPILPFTFYKSLTAETEISDQTYKQVCQDEIVKEALFLASPSLYEEMEKWLANELDDDKRIEKFKFSLLKYLSRMSTRCTPFGLFAGCSLGQFSEMSNIQISENTEHKRHTRPDMNYLVALSQDLVKKSEIRDQLLFYPNSSLYRVGNQFRYVEYKYIMSRRSHHIVAIDHSEYLDLIFGKAKQGSLLTDLANTIVNEEIDCETAIQFIEELVESQLLVSELEPSVSGPEFLTQITEVLEKHDIAKDKLRVLKQTNKKLQEIDSVLGNSSEKYLAIAEELKTIGTDFDKKYLFQTDLNLKTQNNTLDQSLVNDLKKGISLLNKISASKQNTTLKEFIEAFQERFEGREVSLAKALDTEMGIGYKQGQGSDVNPLIDNIVLPGKPVKNREREIKWNDVDSILQEKLRKAGQEKAYSIELADKDFEHLDESWDDLPDTISCLTEIIEEDGVVKIKFNGSGGSSAANLLGRFCHGSKELLSYTQKIILKEKEIRKNKILAEIVHLPESRVGNILMRPDFREYEIPYLAKSIKPSENQLPIEDLMISVNRQNKVVLRSLKFNQEVLPRLSNAHSYTSNSLPIYNFLGDLQTQGTRGGLWLRITFEKDYEFIPRITYKNIILQPAMWNLKKHRVNQLAKVKNDSQLLLKELSVFRKELLIPQHVLLIDGDNELPINLENISSARMLLDMVEKRSDFQLNEFLFSENGIAKRGKDYFTNQVIMSFYNEEILNS